MKKILYILIAAGLLAACDNPMDFKPADKDDELVMNALLDAGEHTHYVTLSVSGTEFVRSVNNAVLRCYVNGTKVATVTEFLEEENDYSYTRFRRVMSFNADFKAGDVVRLEAEAEGKFSAWNEQVVPDTPVLVSVDTTTVEKHTDNSSATGMRFDTRLENTQSGEDFYRMAVYLRRDCTFYDEDDHNLGRNVKDYVCNLDVDNDPILSDGYIGNDEGLGLELGTYNFYGAFTDSQFDGASATLRPIIYPGSSYQYGYYPSYDIPVDTRKVKTDLYAIASVQSISKTHYLYLKAMNNLRGGSDDLALEDIQIPDNVEGGIGFVGLSNSSAKTFFLGSWVDSTIYY